MALEEGSLPSTWAAVGGWLTPTTFFLLLNLVIGFIAVVSRSASRKEDDSERPRQLPQSPSVLDRIRSLNRSIYRREDNGYYYQGDDNYGGGDGEQEAALSRRAFINERLKSFSLSLYRHNGSSYNHGDENASGDGEQGAALSRRPSIIERLRSLSFKLYRYGSGDAATSETTAPPESAGVEKGIVDAPGDASPEYYQQMNRCKSESDAKTEEDVVEAKTNKSLSDKQGSSCFEYEEEEGVEMEGEGDGNGEEADARAEEEEEEEEGVEMEGEGDGNGEEVDARADDFINRFRQQLKLQRLNSITRFRQMLSRGT